MLKDQISYFKWQLHGKWTIKFFVMLGHKGTTVWIAKTEPDETVG